MKDTAIRAIRARQLLDSRGRPTVEVDVELHSGVVGRAMVPSGASTGAAEAHELRDGDPQQYQGLGVLQAATNVNAAIAPRLTGFDVLEQRALDTAMRDLDGTPQLHRLGANAVLGVSLASCRAAAAAQGIALYRHIATLAGNREPVMPVPMVNILSGGLHAGRGMDVQDFLAMPMRATSMAEAVHLMARVRAAATDVARGRGISVLLADEGGIGPGLASPREALDMMIEIFMRAGLEPGVDAGIAIDVASSAFPRHGQDYVFAREGVQRTREEMIDMQQQWIADYPVLSIEDGLGEEDWDGWSGLTQRIGRQVQLVGDDLFTTSCERLAHGIEVGAANGILVKFNQNGTLSGTLDVIARARAAGYATIVSARSGETEDSFMSDLAVGSGSGQIKIGSLRTSNTVCKYNQLLRIAEDTALALAPCPKYTGRPRC